MTTETQVADALDRISRRLDALEVRLNNGAGPVTPVAPEGGLHSLATRLDKIEAAIDAFGTLAQRLPVVADAAATGASWAWQQAEAEGVDPVDAAARGGKLLLELAKPDNLALVEALLAQGPALAAVLDALETVPAADRLAIGAKSGAALAAVLKAPEFSRLLSAASDPATLGTAQQATTALVDVRKQPADGVGLFGAIRRMGDPDVQRAVGFTLALAKRFGQLLASR